MPRDGSRWYHHPAAAYVWPVQEIRWTRSDAQSQCQALSAISALANVFYPNSQQYNSTQQSYWTLQESSLHPSCIVQPSTAVQVGDAVSSLVSRNCSFAIKGRGHAPGAGFANIDDGVTIDLTSMKSVETRGGGSVARVGAGASWLDVYAFLDQSNLVRL